MKKLYFLSLLLLTVSFSYSQTTDLLISKYGEGSASNKFLEIYNGTGSAVDLSNYSVSSCSNGCDTFGEFDFPDNITFAPGTILADGDVYVIADMDADATIIAQTDQTFEFLSNGDDAYALTLAGATADTYTIIDILGDLQGDPGSGWAVGDDTNGTQNQTLTRKTTICSPNPTPLGSFGTDAASSEWTIGDSDSGWDTIGAYTGCVTTPIVTISSPSDGASLASGTSSVDIVFSAANAPAMSTFDITVITNGGAPVVFNNETSPFEISPTADGDTFSVTVELINGGVLASDMTNFEIEYPCTLQIGTITETCDNISPATDDTYTVTLEYTGGGNSDYTIDTGGVGMVGGDDPDSVANGTIVITDVTEGTDFTITFTGDSANSSCDFTRNINSPDCDPQLALPLTETFTYADGPLTANPNWEDYSGTALQMAVNSGEVSVLQDGSQSEDASIAFGGTGGGDIFYSIDFRVPNPGAAITGGDYEYFACFKDGGFGLRGRIDIIEGTGGGDFTVGLSTTGSAADVAWGSDLSFDTTYRATVRYNQDNNIAELWIDASMQTDASVVSNDEADPGTTISEFALRQSNSSTDETIIVDNLIVAATFNETLSTQDITQIDSFRLYPNPTNTGIVNISSSNNGAMNIQVFDVLGKQVKNETLTNNTLNVSSLNKGIYIVKITQNNASTTKKLVIR